MTEVENESAEDRLADWLAFLVGFSFEDRLFADDHKRARRWGRRAHDQVASRAIARVGQVTGETRTYSGVSAGIEAGQAHAGERRNPVCAGRRCADGRDRAPSPG